MLLSLMLSKMVKEDRSEAYSCGVARNLDHVKQFHISLPFRYVWLISEHRV